MKDNVIVFITVRNYSLQNVDRYITGSTLMPFGLHHVCKRTYLLIITWTSNMSLRYKTTLKFSDSLLPL